MMKQTKQAIAHQWQELLDIGKIPVMQFELADGYLEVWVHFVENGSQAYFACEFSRDVGKVKGLSKANNLHVDEYFDSIDHYLQEIYDRVCSHLASKGMLS